MAYDFFPTTGEVIKSALELLRVTDIESPSVFPTNNQYTRAVQSLNYMLTAWQADGLQLWARKEASFSLIQGATSYNVGPAGSVNILQPLKLYNARRKDALSDIEIPLQIYSEKEYLSYPNKEMEGTPLGIYFKPKYEIGVTAGNTATGVIYVYQPADSYHATNTTILFNYQRPFVDFNATTDSLDFPQYWFEAIKYGLAVRLAPVYGTPMLEFDRIKAEAREIKAIAMAYDSEDTSIFLYPKYQ